MTLWISIELVRNYRNWYEFLGISAPGVLIWCLLCPSVNCNRPKGQSSRKRLATEVKSKQTARKSRHEQAKNVIKNMQRNTCMYEYIFSFLSAFASSLSSLHTPNYIAKLLFGLQSNDVVHVFFWIGSAIGPQLDYTCLGGRCRFPTESLLN